MSTATFSSRGPYLERIRDESGELAVILRREFTAEGVHFLTPSHSGQQVGYMRRSQGYVVEAHRHNEIERQLSLTQEVLFIKSGAARIDFYSLPSTYLASAYLYTGDVVILASGGHGLVMLEETEIIEVKQGPHAGELDKTRFLSVDVNEVRIWVG